MNAVVAAAPCTWLHPANRLNEHSRTATIVVHEEMNARYAVDLTETLVSAAARLRRRRGPRLTSRPRRRSLRSVRSVRLRLGLKVRQMLSRPGLDVVGVPSSWCYVRITKRVAAVRSQEEVLPNVKAGATPAALKATISYKHGDAETPHAWKAENRSRASVYSTPGRHDFISTRTSRIRPHREIVARPSRASTELEASLLRFRLPLPFHL